jgi:hypothetical protein
MADVQLVKRLMSEFHRHLFRAGFIALVNEHFDESRLIELSGYHNVLPFLNVHAFHGDKLCVLS